KESTARVASIMENTNLSKQQQVSEIMRQMLTQAQTAGQYFTNDQIKEMTRKVQLDINNTIDHRPEGDEKWFLENEKTVTQFCRKLAAERPLKDIRDEYNYPKKKGIKDECSRLLEASTMK